MLIKIYVETPDNIERAGYYKEVHAEVSTDSLIAELEKRRPCGKCAYWPKPLECEEICCWGVTIVDAFKPANRP